MVEGRFFGRLWTGLQKTRQALTESLGAVFSRQRIDAETLEELEEALILADLGVQTTEKILQEVTKRVKQKTIEDAIKELVGLYRQGVWTDDPSFHRMSWMQKEVV